MHPVRPGIGIAHGYGNGNARLERKNIGGHHPPAGTARAADSFGINFRPGYQIIHCSNDVPCHEIENMCEFHHLNVTGKVSKVSIVTALVLTRHLIVALLILRDLSRARVSDPM